MQILSVESLRENIKASLKTEIKVVDDIDILIAKAYDETMMV